MRQNRMITAWPQNILPIRHWCTLPTQAQMAMYRASHHLRNCSQALPRWSVHTTTYRACWMRLVMVPGKCLQVWSQLPGKSLHRKCPLALARHSQLSQQTTTLNRHWTTLPLLVGMRARPWNNGCWSNILHSAPRRNALLPWQPTHSSSRTVWMRVKYCQFLHSWAILNIRL